MVRCWRSLPWLFAGGHSHLQAQALLPPSSVSNSHSSTAASASDHHRKSSRLLGMGGNRREPRGNFYSFHTCSSLYPVKQYKMDIRKPKQLSSSHYIIKLSVKGKSSGSTMLALPVQDLVQLLVQGRREPRRRSHSLTSESHSSTSPNILWHSSSTHHTPYIPQYTLHNTHVRTHTHT